MATAATSPKGIILAGGSGTRLYPVSGDLGVVVAELLLANAKHFLEVMKVLFDGRPVETASRICAIVALGGGGGEEGDQSVRFFHEDNANRSAGR